MPWNLIGLALSVGGLLGAFLVARNNRAGWIVWVGTNAAWLAYAVALGLWGQSVLWLGYEVLAIYGLYMWRPLAEGENHDA